jgi:hypothetical protein
MSHEFELRSRIHDEVSVIRARDYVNDNLKMIKPSHYKRTEVYSTEIIVK